MELEKFCPECGKIGEKFYGEKSLCKDCYTQKVDLLHLPSTITVFECGDCGKVRNDGKWTAIKEEREKIRLKLRKYTEENSDIEIEIISERNNRYIKAKIEGKNLSQTKNLDVKFKHEICRDCNKFEGDFAKTKIQIRGKKTSKLEKTIENRASNLEKRNHEDYLIERQEVRGGTDYYVSTEHMSQKIMSTLKNQHDVNIETAYQKIGSENGTPIYQNTVSAKVNKDN